jgi:hypothetical protein
MFSCLDIQFLTQSKTELSVAKLQLTMNLDNILKQIESDECSVQDLKTYLTSTIGLQYFEDIKILSRIGKTVLLKQNAELLLVIKETWNVTRLRYTPAQILSGVIVELARKDEYKSVIFARDHNLIDVDDIIMNYEIDDLQSKYFEIFLKLGLDPETGFYEDFGAPEPLLDKVIKNSHVRAVKLLLEYRTDDQILHRCWDIFNPYEVECNLAILAHIYESKTGEIVGKKILQHEKFIQYYHQHMYILIENCTYLYFAMRDNDMFEPMILLEIMRAVSYAAFPGLTRPN